jgi:hypothetical protein
MSGMSFTGSNKYAITATGVADCTLESLRFETARGIDLQTCKRVEMKKISFETEAECLVIGANAVECSARNMEFITTSTSVPAFTYGSGSKNFSMMDAYFSMSNNQQAIGAPGDGLQMKNIRVECQPYTGASTVVVIGGGAASIEGLFMTVTGASPILGGLIQMTSSAGSLRDVQVDLNDQPLAYTGGNNPLIFGGSLLLVENLFLQNMYLVDGGTMALAEPIVAILGGGGAQPTILRPATIKGFTHAGGQVGNMDVCVVGNRASFVGAGTAFTLDDVEIDTSGKTYNTGGSSLIANLSPQTIVKNCKIVGNGAWGRGIHVDGSADVQVRNNHIITSGATWAAGIHVDSNTTTAIHGTSDNCLVDGNQIEMPSFTAAAGMFIGDVTSTTFCSRTRVTNNQVLDGSPSSGSIYFDKCDKPICMGNQTGLNLIAFAGNCTNQKPDAVTIGLGDVNVMI